MFYLSVLVCEILNCLFWSEDAAVPFFFFLFKEISFIFIGIFFPSYVNSSYKLRLSLGITWLVLMTLGNRKIKFVLGMVRICPTRNREL